MADAGRCATPIAVSADEELIDLLDELLAGTKPLYATYTNRFHQRSL